MSGSPSLPSESLPSGSPRSVSPHSPEQTSKQRLRLWLRMLSVTRRIENNLRDRFREQFETTLPRFDVMSALYRFEEGLRMGDISRLLMVSNGNVTAIVDRLEKDGLAERTAVEGDRRATSILLTKKGRETFKKQAETHEHWLDELLQSASIEEVDEMIAMLTRLQESLEMEETQND